MTNVELARRTIAAVRALGVTEFCVCSGSRNAPLLAVLGVIPDVRLFSFVDERSAAFFAVGRAKAHGRPAAVVTTSGTAVAELLPAAIEAHYSGVPIVFITADRPGRYRGTGAPQSIEQEGIFGPHAWHSLDSWDAVSPLHINVEFDEPLIDGPLTAADVTADGERGVGVAPARREQRSQSHVSRPIAFEKPLILIGGLAANDRGRVREFALRAGAPVYAEPLSGLREDEGLEPLLLTSGERILGRAQFDGVVRIGNVPTLRFWRDLDESRRELPVVSFSALPFAGLARGEVHPLHALPDGFVTAGDRELLRLDREMRAKLDVILDSEPDSELAMFRALSHDLPAGTRLYLGNSLPIREWDLVAARQQRGFTVDGNRGANGIDGQLSTFFGWCEAGRENVAIVGDLTALYDANAPWIVPQLDAAFRIVIINNTGGRIFERVASLRAMDAQVRARVIDNAHEVRFDAWAAMWGIGDRVTELRPDLESTRRAWSRYDELWRLS